MSELLCRETLEAESIYSPNTSSSIIDRDSSYEKDSELFMKEGYANQKHNENRESEDPNMSQYGVKLDCKVAHDDSEKFAHKIYNQKMMEIFTQGSSLNPPPQICPRNSVSSRSIENLQFELRVESLQKVCLSIKCAL